MSDTYKSVSFIDQLTKKWKKSTLEQKLTSSPEKILRIFEIFHFEHMCGYCLLLHLYLLYYNITRI